MKEKITNTIMYPQLRKQIETRNNLLTGRGEVGRDMMLKTESMPNRRMRMLYYEYLMRSIPKIKQSNKTGSSDSKTTGN